jgi:hypothetical protein
LPESLEILGGSVRLASSSTREGAGAFHPGRRGGIGLFDGGEQKLSSFCA